MNNDNYKLHLISKILSLFVLTLLIIPIGMEIGSEITLIPDLLTSTIYIFIMVIIMFPILFYYELSKKNISSNKRKLIDLISILSIILISINTTLMSLLLFIPHIIILNKKNQFIKIIRNIKLLGDMSFSEIIVISIILGILTGTVIGYLFNKVLYVNSGIIDAEIEYNYFAFFISSIISSGVIFIFLKRKYNFNKY